MKLTARSVLLLLAVALFPGTGSTATTACNGEGTLRLSDTGSNSTCTFTARGAETYWVASPNVWRFTVQRGSTPIQTVNGGPGSSPTGTLNSKAGDKVTYTVWSTCASAVCFLGSFVEIGANPKDWFDGI